MSTTVITRLSHTTDVWTWKIYDVDLNFRLSGNNNNSCGLDTHKGITSDLFEAAVGCPAEWSKWELHIKASKSSESAPLLLGIRLAELPSNADNMTLDCSFDVRIGPCEKTPAFQFKKFYKFLHYGNPSYNNKDYNIFHYNDLMPASEFALRHSDLYPENILKVTVTMTIMTDVVHHTSRQLSIEEFEKTDHNSLVDSYGHLLNNLEMSDVTITTTDGVEFHAHKFVLKGDKRFRSPVFRVMLESPMKENREGQIDLKMDSLTCEKMLNYIYKGAKATVKMQQDDDDAREDDQTSLLALLDVAELYELNGLKSLCFAKMMEKLNDKTAGDFAVAAYKYRVDPSFTKVIRDFCAARHSQLRKDPQYRKLVIQFPQAFFST